MRIDVTTKLKRVGTFFLNVDDPILPLQLNVLTYTQECEQANQQAEFDIVKCQIQLRTFTLPC